MRLIDADALLSTENQHYAILADEMYVTVRRVELMPTIDAVPVVRCKDCKWWMPNGGEAPASILAIGACGYRKGLERLTTCKWYCADGERKDNDE